MSSTTSSITSNQQALSLSGLASGMNWTAIVQELLTVQAAPESQMQSQETTANNMKAGLQTIGTDLATLGTDATTLSSPSFFESRTTNLSDPSIATATAATGTALGNYTLNVKTLATNSTQIGAKASGALSSTDDVSGLEIDQAGFATPVTAGTFTINGQTVTIAATDTLQSVFDKINTATNGAVTGSYDSSSDTISLTSNGSITLGSDTDTSNFLQVAELYNSGETDNSGTYTVTSAAALGGVNLSDTLDNANLSQSINSGSGQFTINGVAINYNTTTSTVSDILQAINNSAAGVTATYDSVDNRFELTNNSTGDTSISLEDVTGNFLAASGLSSGTLQQGSNLTYSINGAGTMTSQSNTIDAGTSGITGLSVTATGEGVTTISVASDTSTIASAINSFVSDYNTVQSYITSQTATTTSSTGTTTPGLFTGDMDVENIAFTLRQLVGASPPSGSSAVLNLNSLGIASSGNNNTLSAPDSTTLDNMLSNNLSAVQNLFTNAKTGLATTLGSYITTVSSPSGVLGTDEKNETQQAQAMATSVSNLQARLQVEQTTLTDQFSAMETAIESINTDKQYLNDYFNASSASSQSAPTASGSGLSSSSSSSTS